MKTKFLNFLLVNCLVVPCAFTLSACGNNQNTNAAEFNMAQNVSSATETIIENLTDNIYNASVFGSSTSYSVSQIKEKNSDFVYYVELGSLKNIDDVESISIGDSTFEDEQTFDLSIGNSNFISDKCYYEENDKLFVAAPIIAFETVNNSKIKINNDEFDFNLEKTADSKSFTNAEFSSGSTNNVTKGNDNSFNIQFKDAKSFLKLYYDGASANDVVLTKKVVKNSGNEELNNKVNYGLTKVEAETNNPLGFYPIGYSANALNETWSTWYDGATMDYKAYVVGNGVISATLNFDIVIDNAG